MAKIVSKTRKKPDIVVPHSNKSVTNSLINDVINYYTIFKGVIISLLYFTAGVTIFYISYSFFIFSFKVLNSLFYLCHKSSY